MTVFAIFQEDKMFQEKNCYTTGHQLQNVIRHADYKIRSLGFHKAWFPFTANCVDSKLVLIGSMETRPNGNQALCG